MRFDWTLGLYWMAAWVVALSDRPGWMALCSGGLTYGVLLMAAWRVRDEDEARRREWLEQRAEDRRSHDAWVRR